MCRSVLQCVAVCCSMLQYVAVCCSQPVGIHSVSVFADVVCCRVLQGVAGLQCVAVDLLKNALYSVGRVR